MSNSKPNKPLTPMSRYRVLFSTFKKMATSSGFFISELNGTQQVKRRTVRADEPRLSYESAMPNEVHNMAEVLNSQVVQQGVRSDYLMLLDDKQLDFGLGLEVKYKGLSDDQVQVRATLKNRHLPKIVGTPNIVSTEYMPLDKAIAALKIICESAQGEFKLTAKKFLMLFCLSFFANSDAHDVFVTLQKQQIALIEQELSGLEDLNDKAKQAQSYKAEQTAAFFEELHATAEYANYLKVKAQMDQANEALAKVKAALSSKYGLEKASRAAYDSEIDFRYTAAENVQKVLNKF